MHRSRSPEPPGFVEIATKGDLDLKHALSRAQANAGSPGEKLLEMGAAYVAFALENQTVYQLMLSGLIPDFSKHPVLQEAAHACFEELADCVDELILDQHPDIDRKQLSGVLLGAIHGVASLQTRRNDAPGDVSNSALGLNAAVAADIKGSIRLLLGAYL